jgi:hypothetical protein
MPMHVTLPPPRPARRYRIAATGGLLALLLVLGVLMMPVTAMAAPPLPGGAFPELAQANGVSLNQAVAQVQRRTGGRVLSAETRTENGVPVHHIRVLTDNQRVRTIRVDGRTGEWL